MNRRRAAAAAFVLVVLALVPAFAGTYQTQLLTYGLTLAIAALGFNLLLGYTGLLSFGQSLYFGFGAYGVAFAIHNFKLGVIPGFFIGVAAATAIAAIAGFFAVRLTWHYFAIITVVFSLIFYLIAVGWKTVTGGDDGMSFALPPIAQFGDAELTLLDATFQYYFILVIVAACFFLQWLLLRSPLGMAFKAVRENATRAGLIGFNPYLIRLISFIISGLLAGVAGALFALFSRYASAHYMYWTVSGEAVIWTIVGGTGTLFGPVVGAAALTILREELSTVWEHYLIVVGVIVILVVTFAPKGILGSIAAWRAARRAAPGGPDAADGKGTRP